MTATTTPYQWSVRMDRDTAHAITRAAQARGITISEYLTRVTAFLASCQAHAPHLESVDQLLQEHYLSPITH